MSPQADILITAILVAFSCVIPGTFLVLRGVSLMSDAISHAILLGIVIMFFLIGTLDSPLLIVGASISGILTVSITELIISTKRVKEDAAIGLVFPVFFSIGVILISVFAGSIHLDVDAVLLGELAFVPFRRFEFQGMDLGPQSIWVMGTISTITLIFLLMFYKELKITTFDANLAASLGFSPVILHYALMSVSSVTAVGAFESVGSILVVAFMIVPPATAFLVTRRLSAMLLFACFFGILSAIIGYIVAQRLDTSIAGAIATVNGFLFLLTLITSPSQGIIPKLLQHRRQSLSFSARLLAVQLLAHEGTSQEESENSIENMIYHMGWTESFAYKIARKAVQDGLISRHDRFLKLTPLGREVARTVMVT